MKLLQFIRQTAARLFYVALVASFASGLSNALVAGLLSQQITAGDGFNSRFIGWFALLILVVVLLDFVAKQALNLLLNRIHYELRLSFASQLLTTPFPTLERIGSPRLQALLIEDTRTIGQVVAELPTLCIGLATVLGCVLYLGWLAPWTLLTVMLLALPLFVGYWQLQRHTSQILHTVLAIRDQFFSYYRDLTDGLKELKLHQQRLSDFYHTHLQPLLEQAQASSIRYYRFHFLAQSVNHFTYFIIILGLLLSNQWLHTPLEVLGAYAIMILYLKTATMTLISALPRWSEAQTTLRQIEALGFTLSAPTPIKALTGLCPVPGPVQIDLQGLTYAYFHAPEEHSFHLGPLNCSLRSGEIVFITGGNGSGKTTFLKLLIGLYTSETGHMVWNGRPVTPETLEEYRQNFAVIFAEPYLFAHLLGLTWGNLDQRAQVWLKQLQL